MHSLIKYVTLSHYMLVPTEEEEIDVMQGGSFSKGPKVIPACRRSASL